MVRATEPVYLAAVAPAPRVATPIALVPQTAPVSGLEVAAGGPAPNDGGVLGGTEAGVAGGSDEAAAAVFDVRASQAATTTVAAPTTDAGSIIESRAVAPVLTTVAGIRAVSGGFDSAVAGSTGLQSG
jgi:hypothetical protein